MKRNRPDIRELRNVISNVSNHRRVLLKGDGSESFVIRLAAAGIKRIVWICLRVKVREIGSIEIRMFLRLGVELRVVQKGLREGCFLNVQLIRLATREIELVRSVNRLRTRVKSRVNRAKWSLKQKEETSGSRGLDRPGRRRSRRRERAKGGRGGGRAEGGRKGESKGRRGRGRRARRSKEEGGRGKRGGRGGAAKDS
jgi:hypothetical protein